MSNINEKHQLLEVNYPDLYATILREGKQGNFPLYYGLSQERMALWKDVVERAKLVDNVVERLYDELAQLGRFGEDARNENYILQHLLRGEKNFDEADAGSGVRFLATYPVLVWTLYFSTKNELQRNSVRLLVFAHGTIDEKKYVLSAAKKLPVWVLKGISNVETMRLIITTNPKLVEHIEPINVKYFVDTLAREPWHVLIDIARGTLLPGKTVDSKSILRLIVYGPVSRNELKKRFRSINNALRTGIVHFTANERDELLELAVLLEGYLTSGPVLSSTYWESYNPQERGDLRLPLTEKTCLRFIDEFVRLNPDFDYTRIVDPYKIIPDPDNRSAYLNNPYLPDDLKWEYIIKARGIDLDYSRIAKTLNEEEWAFAVLRAPTDRKFAQAQKLRPINSNAVVDALDRYIQAPDVNVVYYIFRDFIIHTALFLSRYPADRVISQTQWNELIALQSKGWDEDDMKEMNAAIATYKQSLEHQHDKPVTPRKPARKRK